MDQQLLIYSTVDTASAFLDQPTSKCFQFVVAKPKHSLSNGSKVETSTPEECQSICRNTYGCKIFQWIPKIWKESGLCQLKALKPKWSIYEWYMLPNAIAGPPICTRKKPSAKYAVCLIQFLSIYHVVYKILF